MRPRPSFRWWAITLYAIAMAFVEAACVVTLKRLFYPGGWHPPFEPMPADAIALEQVREAATLVMIAAVAGMGRPTWREGLARGLWIFGLWDLLYYVFLRVLTGFPASLTDADIVFLIPIAWIFPVWVPVLVSLLGLVVARRLHAAAGGRS